MLQKEKSTNTLFFIKETSVDSLMNTLLNVLETY